MNPRFPILWRCKSAKGSDRIGCSQGCKVTKVINQALAHDIAAQFGPTDFMVKFALFLIVLSRALSRQIEAIGEAHGSSRTVSLLFSCQDLPARPLDGLFNLGNLLGFPHLP